MLRGLSCSHRPSHPSWPPFQYLSMFAAPRKLVSLDLAVPVTPEGAVCPCCLSSLCRRGPETLMAVVTCCHTGDTARTGGCGFACGVDVPDTGSRKEMKQQERHSGRSGDNEEKVFQMRCTKVSWRKERSWRGQGAAPGGSLSMGWRCPVGGQGCGQPSGRPAQCRSPAAPPAPGQQWQQKTCCC